MAPRMVPYVDVPSLSPRKRKPSRSPSPAESESSRASSPNLSPRKQTRAAKDVDVTTGRLSKIIFNTSPSGSRPLSPTVSDFIPSHKEGEASGDGESISSENEVDSSGTSGGDVVFRFDEDIDYVAEAQLSKVLRETLGQGVPIRRLFEFALFKCDGLLLINPLELLDLVLPAGMYGACGLVTPVHDEDSDEAGEEDSVDGNREGYLVQLAIAELSVHHFSADESDEEVDENIYIKTKDAWYILDTPSSIYRPFWSPFRVLHRFAHRIIMDAFENRRITYDEFVASLNSQNTDELLTEAAFKSDEVLAYLVQTIGRVVDLDAPIKRVPLIRSLIDQPLPILPPLEQRSKRAAPRKTNEDSETFLMPITGRIVEKYLISPVSVVGAELNQAHDKIAHEIKEALEHHEDPKSMRWGNVLDDQACYYSSVKMDGVTYSIGDVVAVAPGPDSNKARAATEQIAATHCVNAYANRAWFIRIMYFLDEMSHGTQQKMFHGQWFVHGSRTFSGEFSHSQELYLLPECGDVPVAAIYSKCQVHFFEPGDKEEPDRFDPQARDYFCRSLYDDRSHASTDLPSSDDCALLRTLFPADRHCVNCGREAEQELARTVQVIGDETNGYGLMQRGLCVHVGEFVYVKPDVAKKQGLVLFIAQVTGVDHKAKTLRVRYYKRDTDSRCIYRTRRKNDVSVEDLDGSCFVRHLDPDDHADGEEIESWVKSDSDHFYTYAGEYKDGLIKACRKDSFDCCLGCFNSHCDELEEHIRFVRRNGQRTVFEVFAGAGGLSQGLGESGFFTTKWALELSYSAATTFRLNHPGTNVLIVDINAFVKYSVDRRDGKNPSPLRSTDGKIIPENMLPVPGEHITLLAGGPPCQSFSGANSHKKEDDPRSALPFAMLSLAELFEPDYIIIENVVGLLRHSVPHPANDGRRVENAMPKLIIRGLAALGYQNMPGVMQAGQYGVPQDRERVIFWGAKRGLTLPKRPVPTHASRSADKHSLKTHFITPVQRGGDPEDDHIFAPHAIVTVDDAIGDLPPFEWKDPHEIVPETAADVIEVQARIAQGIQQFDASEAPVGFRDGVGYATEPTTRYQKAMRRANPTVVKNHVTDQVSLTSAELTTQIPLKPYANHKFLKPEYFKTSSKFTLESKMCYGRLDGNGLFKTAMTTVQPRARGSYVLHPTQKRTISVVEAKRCQGFPDHYILWSDKRTASGRVKDYFKHIGNAVPVPLAAALGRSLEAAVMSTQKTIRRELSPIVEDLMDMDFDNT
ncbi:S-adenosyl-L-methionine-dependent methyltransferase [Mycena latifolia]|nr:S-adenosyl-L-methionine-dependent methyltransferase [Mycena latifolia]